MIDTAEATLDELSALITMLETILVTRRHVVGPEVRIPSMDAELSREVRRDAERRNSAAQTAFAADFGPEITAAEAFGGANVPAGTNVLPFPQPTPASTAAAPAGLTAVAPAVAPPAAVAPIVAAAPSDAIPTTGIVSDAAELDSAGLPWDARIHSDTHNKKVDGTWRLRRNLDETVKNAVMAEYRGENPPTPPVQVPLPPAHAPVAAANIPVPPPPPPVLAGAGADPAVTPIVDAALQAHGVPTVIPPPPGAVPVPPPLAVGVPNPPESVVVPPPPMTPAAPSGDPMMAAPRPMTGGDVAPGTGATGTPVTTFRDLMGRINRGLAAGTTSQPKVMEACNTVKLSSITALAKAENADKVPQVAQLLGV